jgi:hypothetical protein
MMLETNLFLKSLKKIYYFFTKLRNMTRIKDKPKGNGFLVQAMKAYWVSIGTAALIINLGSRWRRVVHFTLRPPYPPPVPEKEPREPLNKRLGGPQSRTGVVEEYENLLISPRIEPRTVQAVVWSLYRMSYAGSSMNRRRNNKPNMTTKIKKIRNHKFRN